MSAELPIIDVPGVMHADAAGVRYARFNGAEKVTEFAAWADVYKIEYEAGDSPVITIYRKFSVPDSKSGIYRGIVPEGVPFTSWSVAERAFQDLLELRKAYAPSADGHV